MSAAKRVPQCPLCGKRAIIIFDPQQYHANWMCREPKCIEGRKEQMRMSFLPTMDQLEFNYGLQ